MKKKIKVLVADPAGNITYFVKDETDRKDYASIASQILKMKLDGKEGEQVAFILNPPTCGRARGKMEMCGLEFCGNASRSFALITARELEKKNGGEKINSVSVDVSGVNEILDVKVDTETGYTKIKMPMPVRVFKEEILGAPARAVDFGGILHIVVDDISPTRETFEKYKEYINKKYNPPAMGVMFWNTKEKKLVPVVYVKDVDTTYFEGSCGSGTTACCVTFGLEEGDGEHSYVFPQPAGTIEASCIVKAGELQRVFIEGSVKISDEIEVEVEVTD